MLPSVSLLTYEASLSNLWMKKCIKTIFKSFFLLRRSSIESKYHQNSIKWTYFIAAKLTFSITFINYSPTLILWIIKIHKIVLNRCSLLTSNIVPLNQTSKWTKNKTKLIYFTWISATIFPLSLGSYMINILYQTLER